MIKLSLYSRKRYDTFKRTLILLTMFKLYITLTVVFSTFNNVQDKMLSSKTPGSYFCIQLN